MLRNREDEPRSDLRVDVIGGVVLIDATGQLEGDVSERLGGHLEQIRSGRRPVVVDLSRVTAVDDRAVAALRALWREVGDGLRVVAPPGSVPARALKAARLRRFEIHASLSGALVDASAR